MTQHTGGFLAVLAAASLLASGCSDFRAVAGLERTVPDEFAVVSRAPLTIPPSFDLPPPTPGAPRPQEGTADVQAETVLFGGRRPGFYFDGQYTLAAAATMGEAALLARAGTDIARSDIRLVVNREADQEIEDAEGVMDDLLFWQDDELPGQVVDPEKEKQRLANNAALGLPINEGEVPVIEAEDQAPLEGLFGS